MAKEISFEQLLEYVVNGETTKAEELFHQLVVAKSREIYENLIEDEMKDVDIDEASKEEDDEEMDEARKEDDEEMDEAASNDDEEMDEAREEDDEEMDESADEEEMDESSDEEEMDEMFGGDATDDMMHDVGDEGESDDDAMDLDDEGEDSIADRVDDLENTLADLEAKFQELMADEKHEPEHHDGVDDPDFGDDDDSEDDEDSEDESFNPAFEEEIEEIQLSPAAQMREYVEKVTAGHGAEKKGSGEASGANTKSTVAKKNDMGGTTANIAKGGEGSDKGTKGGLLDPSTKPQDGGNVNVPGAKNATKLSAVSKGHGAEKKGTGEAGGTNTKGLFK